MGGAMRSWVSTTFSGSLGLVVMLVTPARSSPPLVEACFAPGTPWRVVEETAQRMRGVNISLAAPAGDSFQFNDGDRWSETVTDGPGLRQGDPTTVTWSVVPDGTSVFGYAGEPTADSNLRSRLNGIYGSSATWIALLQQVFDRWSAITGLTYVYEPTDDGADMTDTDLPPGQIGVRGDVRIAGHALDGNLGVLAYNFGPDFSEMIIDTNDNFFNDTSLNSLGLRNTVAHEHGHGLGLQHVCPINETKLMEPFLSRNFDGPQHDDLLAGNRGYGDPMEPNDTSGTAADLGTLVPGTPIALTNRSIDDNSDADFFAFQIDAASRITATMTPAGSTYPNASQSSTTGNCNPSANFDSLRQHNLGIEVRDRNGTTVLASANTGGLGVAETISGLTLGTPGRYFVRVFGTTTNAAQLYGLNLQSTSTSAPILSLAKDVASAGFGPPYPVGSVVEYTITVQNTGTGPATNVVITDCLASLFDPLGITVLDGGTLNSPPPAPTGCTGDWVKWTLGGPVVPSGVAAVRFRATIPLGLADGTLVDNTAQVSSLETALQSSNRVRSATCAPTITTTKLQDQPSYRPGDLATWTLTVSNTHANCPVTAVTIADAIDLALVEDAPTLTWTDPPGSSSSKAGATITWTLPSLTAGASAVMTVSSRVRAGATGNLCNDADSDWNETLTPVVSNQVCAPIQACPLGGVARVTDLRARRAPSAQNVELQWSSVSGSEEYDLWRIEEDKTAIPGAGRGAPAPVFGVASCSDPNPTTATTCVDPGVIPSGTLHFYQVRGSCAGAEGAI